MNNFDTLISSDRYQYIDLHIIPEIKSIDGDICEIGVYRGGSLEHFARMCPEKNLIGIDTFEGLPAPSDFDRVTNLGDFPGHQKGDFGDVNYDELKRIFEIFFKNVMLIRGCFPSDEIINQIKDRQFCFVHVDVDLYQSVKDCCEYFYPMILPRGVILFDDYGFDSTPGCKRAVDEFFKDKTDCIKRILPTKQFCAFKRG